jgi:hypothetical protein
MRDMRKFKQDEQNGLFIKSMRAGEKGLTTTIVASTISRALRRHRITKDVARRASVHWAHEQCNRPKSQIWSLVANDQLLEVARLRKQGKVSLAKVVLKNARDAIIRSHQLQAA